MSLCRLSGPRILKSGAESETQRPELEVLDVTRLDWLASWIEEHRPADLGPRHEVERFARDEYSMVFEPSRKTAGDHDRSLRHVVGVPLYGETEIAES